MDVKTAFLNGDFDEMIYMVQYENFFSNESKSMVCKLKKSIYDLKQASRQWYHKLHQVITSYGFEANVVDDCVYHKFSGSKYIFLVLYVNDILLASSDTGLLHETKRFLTKNFEMNDLEETSFVLGIQILRDRSQDIMRLSQENYISKVLERFSMKDSKIRDTLIVKGDKFSLKQCPNNNLERNEMQKIPYASVIGSLIYAQVCTRPNIAFVVGVLDRRTKGYMLTYRKSESLEIIGYFDSNFVGCEDHKCSTPGYIYMLAGGAISWKSPLQPWLRNFVTSLRVVDGIERPLKIHCYNNSAVLYSNNNRSSTKSKFINIKFLVLSRVGRPQVRVTFQGTGKAFLPFLGLRQVPSKSKRAIVLAIPKTENKKVLPENLSHRPQSLFHNNLTIPEPVLRLHAAPSNVHHNPPSLPQPPSQLLPRGRLLKLGNQAPLGEQIHHDPREAVGHGRVQRVADVDEEALPVLPLEPAEVEILPPDLDDGGVEFPAVEDGFGIKVEEEAGGGTGAEAEEGEGAGGQKWRERGEDVEVGIGEGFEEEGYAVDVSGGVQEKEPGPAEGVLRFSRNF
ncbi:hypothetical protein CR513_40277, partial [Mucuna pruriens]